MKQKPNVVFITTHDTGTHFGCYGFKTVASPAIDALAGQGVRFTECFAAATLCSPSRGAMMTGRWPQSNGMMGLTHSPHWWRLGEDEKHLARLMRENGYKSHLFHYQHEDNDPFTLGFEEWHCRPGESAHDEMPDPYIHRPASEVAEDFSKFCGSKAAQEPFYAQIGFFETHVPLDFGGNTGDDSLGVEVPGDWPDSESNRNFFKLIQGAVVQTDRAVKTIVTALEENGLSENTIVVFTVDHGLQLPRAKGTVYDAGMRTALIIRAPGVSGGATLEELISNIDVTPTVLELAGIAIPENIQGVSLAGVLNNSDQKTTREYVYGELGPKRCVRSTRYKLIRNFEGGTCIDLKAGWLDKSNRRALPFVELYDVLEDPTERKNLARDPEFGELRKEYDNLLFAHLKSVGDPILKGPVVSPYYRKAMAHFQNR